MRNSLLPMNARLSPEQLTALRATPREDRLRVAFALSGAKQYEVADLIGVAESRLSGLLKGRAKTERLAVESASALADIFGCTVEDLFPRNEAA